MNYIFIFIGAAFVNNFILTQFLGLCPFFGVSRKTETAVGMGLSIMFVMTLSSAMTFLFFTFVLVPLGIAYLQTLVFILIIASIVQFVEVFMKKKLSVLYNLLGIYLPLVTVNCAIFGVALINIRDYDNFLAVILNSLGAGSGFFLAIIILASIREKLEFSQEIPELFKGFPLALFSAGLMSIAFMGFQGLF